MGSGSQSYCCTTLGDGVRWRLVRGRKGKSPETRKSPEDLEEAKGLGRGLPWEGSCSARERERERESTREWKSDRRRRAPRGGRTISMVKLSYSILTLGLSGLQNVLD